MWLALLITLFFCVTFFIFFKYNHSNAKLIEKFDEKEKKIMSKFDRYNEIVKGFDEVRQVKPSPNELNSFYDFLINEDKYTSEDVKKLINDDHKFKNIILDFEKKNKKASDVKKNINPKIQTTKSNSINEVEDDKQAGILVEKSYTALFPGERLTTSNKDFLIYKLHKLDNDVTRFEDYLTSDIEYKKFIKKKIDAEVNNHLTKDDEEEILFEIRTPNINETTLKKTRKSKNNKKSNSKIITCQDLEDEHVLSKIINERNLSELKYSCLRSKNKYANLDENMVLLPGQEWNVPQKHPEICRMSGQFNYQASTSQTALIGTLLDASKDTQVGSILPEFNFDEKS